MNRLHRLLLLSAVSLTVNTNGSFAQPAQRPEAKSAPTIDATMMRLLDDDKVRAELRLDAGQELLLELRVGEHKSTRQKLTKASNKLNPADKQRVAQEVGQLRTKLYQEVGKALRPEQLARLAQVKLQVIGASCVFSIPSLQKSLDITPVQEKKFLDALISFEDALYADYRKLPKDIARDTACDRLMRVRATEKERLDRTIVNDILDAVQHKRLKEAMGPDLVLDIDLVRPEILHAELHARANRIVPRHHRAYPIDIVVRLPVVRSMLQTSTFENERIMTIVAEWDKAQDGFHASMQYLNPRLQALKSLEWEKSYNAAVPVFEEKLRNILGGQRFERLKQIRRQICGPQTVLSFESIPGNELTSQQRDRIEKARQELGVELSKRVNQAVLRRTYFELTPLYAGHIDAGEKAILDVFTPVQREGWQRLIGEPLDAGLLKSLRTEVGNRLQELPVRRG